MTKTGDVEVGGGWSLEKLAVPAVALVLVLAIAGCGSSQPEGPTCQDYNNAGYETRQEMILAWLKLEGEAPMGASRDTIVPRLGYPAGVVVAGFTDGMDEACALEPDKTMVEVRNPSRVWCEEEPGCLKE